MLYVFIWVLFGLFSVMLAGRKNRSKINWLIIGVLLGPFSLIVAFFKPLEKEIISHAEKRSNITNSSSPEELLPSYTYQIKTDALDDDWNTVRLILLKKLPVHYRVIEDDGELYHVILSDHKSFKMKSVLRKEGGYITINSVNAGEIDFADLSGKLVMSDKC